MEYGARHKIHLYMNRYLDAIICILNLFSLYRFEPIENDGDEWLLVFVCFCVHQFQQSVILFN